MLRIGIVGCGAIGTSLAESIVRDFSGQARLSSLYDIDKNKAVALARRLRLHSIVAPSLDYLIKRVNLAVEATEAKSCFAIARSCLSRGCDIIIMSVGGIVTHTDKLANLARRKKAKIYIPSGAVCGIDGLKAATQKRINRITLITYKNPRSFDDSEYIRHKGIRLDKIKGDTLLFSGSAQQAIKIFPKNINVSATLSIAGIGTKRTRVKIIASPKIKRNIHQIYVESDAGIISTRVENLIHPDNPKTSFLAVLSAISTLKQILEPIRVGT